jgi:hypothetical protein
MKPFYYFFIGLGIGLVLLGIASLFVPKVRAADLAFPLPKPRPAVVGIPATLPEKCLVTGEEPASGQTLHVDKRCKSGLRWVYQR